MDDLGVPQFLEPPIYAHPLHLPASPVPSVAAQWAMQFSAEALEALGAEPLPTMEQTEGAELVGCTWRPPGDFRGNMGFAKPWHLKT